MSERSKADNKAAMAEHLIGQYRALVASELAGAAGSADVIVAEGYYRMKARAEQLEAALVDITRTAYDEANRIANHCSDGAALWAMRNLYDAANKAKAVLSPNAE